MFIYELDARGALRTVTHARHSKFRDAAWMLESVRRSDVSAGGVVTRLTAKTEWDAPFGPDLVKLASVRLESLSGLALVRYIDYLRNNRLDTAAHEPLGPSGLAKSEPGSASPESNFRIPTVAGMAQTLAAPPAVRAR